MEKWPIPNKAKLPTVAVPSSQNSQKKGSNLVCEVAVPGRGVQWHVELPRIGHGAPAGHLEEPGIARQAARAAVRPGLAAALAVDPLPVQAAVRRREPRATGHFALPKLLACIFALTRAVAVAFPTAASSASRDSSRPRGTTSTSRGGQGARGLGAVGGVPAPPHEPPQQERHQRPTQLAPRAAAAGLSGAARPAEACAVFPLVFALIPNLIAIPTVSCCSAAVLAAAPLALEAGPSADARGTEPVAMHGAGGLLGGPVPPRVGGAQGHRSARKVTQHLAPAGKKYTMGKDAGK